MISFMYMYLFLLSADPANRHEIQVLKFSWWSLDARIGFWGYHGQGLPWECDMSAQSPSITEMGGKFSLIWRSSERCVGCLTEAQSLRKSLEPPY